MTKHENHFPISADEALQLLIEGNERFQRGEVRISQFSTEILSELAKGQKPFATILGCSDSRVAPEIIFDAHLGQLFVIRVAGNVMSPEVAGSMQYAGHHLQTPLFVVLGHEQCGAVQAALEVKFRGGKERERIQLLTGHPDGHPEISLFAASGGQTPQMQGTVLTVLLLGHIYSVHQTISEGFFRFPPESFALLAPVVVGGLLVMEIL